MPFSFAAREIPVTLRLCRSLLWAQAAYTLFGGAFVLLTAVLLGGSYALPFHDASLTGGGAAMLGLVYVIAGVTLGWLAVGLGRLAPWARPAIVSMQVFLAILQLFRAFDLSVATIINVALYVAILALLFVPDTRRALAGTAQV